MPYKIRLVVLTLLLWLPAAKLFSQPFYFKHYQAEDGLLNNTVLSLLQDSRGFMWVGTKGGLNRFDGYTFKSYKSSKSQKYGISSDAVTSLCEDKKGIMWVGTSRGMFKYDPLTESFDQLFLKTHEISNILIDKKNNLWFLSNNRLFEYDQTEKKLADRQLAGRCMTIDAFGRIWLGKMDGKLICYDPATKATTVVQIIDKDSEPKSKVITKVLAINNNEILIGTRQQGLKLYSNETATITSLITHDGNKNDIFVRDLISADNDIYWIATESGVFRYNHRNSTFQNLRKQIGDNYSLSDNAVYCLTKDNHGGLWAGTFFGGLNYCSVENSEFKKYYPVAGVNAISGNAVREICGDKNGKIWIGTEDAGLNKFDPVTGNFTHFDAGGLASSISYPNVHGLLVDDDKAYVGTFQHGLDIMDTRTGKAIMRYKLVGTDDAKSDFVMSVYKRKNGELLIGTAGGGLLSFDERLKKFERIAQIPKNGTVYCILEDHEGTVWSGGLHRGVFYFNDNTGKAGNITFRDPNDPNSREEIVQGVYEDKENNLWFATDGNGLIRLSANRKTLKRYTTENGLPSNNLYRILEDDNHNLWVSSLKGLLCFNTQTESIKVYTQANGLITDQFNYNSAYKDASGNMYFGSVKGLIVFNPRSLAKIHTTIPTYITGFQINNSETNPSDEHPVLKKSILFTDTISLSYNQSTFSIEFAALSFSSAPVTRYKYIMKGLDANWTYLNVNRKAYFTDLSPGSYTFLVRAESNVNNWTGREKRLFIRIYPPIWKSPAAYVLYCLLAFLSIYFIILFYHRYLEKKNIARLKLYELEKEKEIYQANIEFFTNIAHEIQTPLTLIIGPVDQVKKQIDDYPLIKKNFQLIDKSANRLLSLTDQLLDFRKTEMNEFGLSFVSANISALLKEQLSTFQPEAEKRKVNLSINLPKTPLIAFVDLEAFNKITSNLLSNAIKYADGKVVVSLNVNDNNEDFSVLYVNDGQAIPEAFEERIFEPFFRLKGNDKPGTGIGLSLARSLTELHNGTLKIKNGGDNLITFELRLPIHQKFEFKLNKWKNIK